MYHQRIYKSIFILIMAISFFINPILSVSAEEKETNDIQEILRLTYAESKEVGIDKYETLDETIEIWYNNLPEYRGEVVEEKIDFTSFQNNDKIVKDSVSSGIAFTQIKKVENQNGYFKYWKNANLTTPISLYNFDDQLYAHAYGIVDSHMKLVGYILIGVSEKSPPVIEYSINTEKYTALKKADKAYFSPMSGIWIENEGALLSSITNDCTIEKDEVAKLDKSEEAQVFFESTSESNHNSWINIIEEAKHSLSDSKVESNVLDKANSLDSVAESRTVSDGNQVRVAMDTSDYTWQTVCGYTCMAMYFDAIGRRVDPCLMGTMRPHSIELNSYMHSIYGCHLTFNDIADIIYDWAITRRATATQAFSMYKITTTNLTSNAACYMRHVTQINKDIPTLVGYSYTVGGNSYPHITMGIGYTTDDFYIIRDTFTNNGHPMESSHYYNKDSYNYKIIGLDYNLSGSSNEWGNLTLERGDGNINVKRLKHILYLLYYEPGTLNSNLFDAATESAVMQFQSDNGLVADGIVGPDTYYALMRAHIMCYDSNTSTWRVLYNGLCGDDVAQLQIRLYRLGYLNGECDGIFGTATENALIDYQEDKGLVADGIAGAATFAKMTGTYSRYEREYRPCNECPNS